MYKQNASFKVYVGLWSAWWRGEGDEGGMKVVLATIENQSDLSDRVALGQLPWIILQLQTLTPEDPSWEGIRDLLKSELHVVHSSTVLPCPGRLTYDQVQDDMTRRTLAQPLLLQDYSLIRNDTPSNTNARPQSVLDRQRIAYNVHLGRKTDLRVQPLQVYIEKVVPTRVSLGQRLHSDSGLSKEATLLSAVGEWRTWIVLGA